ncbi:MAG TPA: preprotein translocase subunit Sec61beta [archaeon]|jgi:preprotein translocase subunit Sec61beta|nr:preprotein translocase subunit Sec61beta [archaeon]
MKMNYSKNTTQGPSSAIGIMKFKESNAGPALTPEMVIGFAIAVAVLILIAKFAFGL